MHKKASRSTCIMYVLVQVYLGYFAGKRCQVSGLTIVCIAERPWRICIQRLLYLFQDSGVYSLASVVFPLVEIAIIVCRHRP